MRKRLLEAEAALRATSSKRVKVEQEQSDDEDETCDWCLAKGHTEMTCPNIPFCRNCGSDDHKTSNCPDRQSDDSDSKRQESGDGVNAESEDESDSEVDPKNYWEQESDDYEFERKPEAKEPTKPIQSVGAYQSTKYLQIRYKQQKALHDTIKKYSRELPPKPTKPYIQQALQLLYEAAWEAGRQRTEEVNECVRFLLKHRLLKNHQIRTDMQPTLDVPMTQYIDRLVVDIIHRFRFQVAFKCNFCGKKGHIAAQCRNEYNPYCKYCHENGHFKSKCPILKERVCKLCGQKGDHWSSECTKSFLSLKCHLCGGLGHLNAVCPDRDLYEMKEAANHLDLHCDRCGGLGHETKECPRRFEYKCMRCGAYGHLMDDCMLNKDMDRPLAFGKEQKGPCYFCGEMGHVRSECPDVAMKCGNCGDDGHHEEECPHPKIESLKQCRVCGSKDHWWGDCPQEVKCSNCGKNHRLEDCILPKGGICYNCGEEGHWMETCPNL